MFVQVIQGKVSDPARARERLDTWVADLGPSADGWLGSTSGVTDDGTLVMLARFESEDAARANSDRPEQGEWWAATESVFDGEPTFHDSTQVKADTPGDPDAAGFVQVMQGRVNDTERALALMDTDDSAGLEHRPDILGRLLAVHEGGEWTMFVYFSSEEDARAGEQKPPPPEAEARMAEMQEVMVGEPTFADLRDPWLSSPG